MAGLLLANHIWDPHEPKKLKLCSLTVEYTQPDNTYKRNYYLAKWFKIDPSMLRFSFTIIRDGGGIDCEITAERKSTQEGSLVVQTHSQQHISYLREEYKLWSKEIRDGEHFNSMKYRAYYGHKDHPEGKRWQLVSEVKNSQGAFVTRPYTLQIEAWDFDE